MISIVMPIYNQVAWITESVRCILNQTYKDFELIIVDDGSTDGSTEVLKKFADKYPKISYYRKDNGGTGSALNLGFSHAMGEYGTWISGDNLYNDNMLQKLLDVLQQHSECGLIFSSFILDFRKDPDDAMKTKKRRRYCVIGAVSGIMEDFIFRSASKCITGICYLFDMNLKRECGDYAECPGEDYLMGVRMGLKRKVYYLTDTLGMWQSHADCVTVKARHIVGMLDDPILGITVNQMVKNLINTGNVI